MGGGVDGCWGVDDCAWWAPFSCLQGPLAHHQQQLQRCLGSVWWMVRGDCRGSGRAAQRARQVALACGWLAACWTLHLFLSARACVVFPARGVDVVGWVSRKLSVFCCLAAAHSTHSWILLEMEMMSLMDDSSDSDQTAGWLAGPEPIPFFVCGCGVYDALPSDVNECHLNGCQAVYRMQSNTIQRGRSMTAAHAFADCA